MGVGNWFDDNLRRVVGDGVNTVFWTDQWIGGISLSVRFSCSSELSESKDMTVADMFSLGLGEGGET